MVKNGYTLLVPSAEIPEFLDKARGELKSSIREQLLLQLGKVAERLYDMKFIEQRKYDSSIFDLALETVAGRLSAVALGAVRDPLYDFRSTLIVAKSDAGSRRQFVLLNTENATLRQCFEKLPKVKPYKFDRFLSEEDPDYEANRKRGEFWHGIFEAHDWSMSMMGYAAQLSVQPDITAMGVTPEELNGYFSSPDVRRMDYVRESVAITYVRGLVGNTPIEKINPYTLLEYFEQARHYLDTETGKDACALLDEKVCKGFGEVDIASLTLSAS